VAAARVCRPALRVIFSRATIGFGEFGYYFHCLSSNVGWFHSVYPSVPDFARHQHDITPLGLNGYWRFPASHREAYENLTAYVTLRREAYGGWMGAYMTHRFEYEAYAPRRGAQIISMEIGEDVPNTQSKIAIARGASRAAQLPWSAQVSPWHGPSVTTHGPVLFAGGVWQGADAGHSASFYVRLYAHVWFAGAAFLTPENSIAIFYDVLPNSTHAGILSAHGEAARQAARSCGPTTVALHLFRWLLSLTRTPGTRAAPASPPRSGRTPPWRGACSRQTRKLQRRVD
jgi:hypothetical protein